MASAATPLSIDPSSFEVLEKIEGQFCNEEVLVRLLHFWEARNFKKGNVLMGVELLLLDTESNAVQGFISANRLFRHEESLKRNSVYKLKKFMIRPAKALYRVSDHKNTICFTDLTTMVPVVGCDDKIATQKFRLRRFNDFTTIADRDYDLFDAIGQLRLVTGDNLKSPTTAEPPMEAAENRSKDRVFLHLIMQDGETIRVNLWGDIAGAFRATWNTSLVQPTVILITTVNPKTIGGAVTLNSTSATRLFFDTDVPETAELITSIGRGPGTTPTVTTASSAITKYETVTIAEINQFLQNEPQVVSFYCIGTVVDVLGQSGWNYVSCTSAGCNAKLGKTETSLYCAICKKTNNVGLLRYRFEISVRDKNGDVATFVVFDADGRNIAGRNAADVLNESIQSAGEAARHEIQTTAPGCLRSIVGRTCKFQIRIKEYNFTASRQTFTVSRIVTDDATFDALPPSVSNAPLAVAETSVKKRSTPPMGPGTVPAGNQPSVGDPTANTVTIKTGPEEYDARKQEKRPRVEN